ncbi:DUF4349 domain-containing protein [Sphingorhabdus sp.]|jgi:hypothetical protein|uniref:DUF4349 domain-containing protein n=4 Tax=Sphingorhabdus sp. TaxID=1902408 RepID=UPI003BB106E4|nr:DUF4349 domain-containing protein [Sphingomonadales bacterium]MBK9431989.1 DUF4349 domain-containing protein [Sphingomonadales bacterium]
MRKSLIIALPLLAALAGCQNAEEAGNEPIATEAAAEGSADIAEAKDAAAEAEIAASGGAVFSQPAAVSPSVAPGVAFQYSYDFRVPGDKIEGVQDEHAAACETLGLSRCQITGLNFSQSENGYPEGRMEFLLDPAIARKFGRDAIASVEKAEGVLTTSNVSGENVGAEIASSQVRSAGMEAEVKRIEERLAGKGLANDERVELRRRAEELRDMMGGEKETRRNGEKRIATTPVQFNYSGNMGIGGSGAFGDALSASTDSMTSMLGLLLMLAGVVLPWLLPIGAVVLFVKSPLGAGLRRWWGRNTPLADEPAK